MEIKYFESYFSQTYSLEAEEVKNDSVVTGCLMPKQDGLPVSIVRGIPRFIEEKNYADNFGFQWNRFRTTQLDSQTGLTLSADRFWSATMWSKEELRGKKVLEVGSGAGRFTEILLECEARVVSFDYSTAVEANYANNIDKGDLFLFQGDLYDIPFPDNYFDYVFCYGVLQHTPDMLRAYRAIFNKLKPEGKLSTDFYRTIKGISPWSTPKKLWRPVTRHMNPEILFKIISFYIPYYLPIDCRIRKIPRIGFYLAGLIPIPCWNYMRLGLEYNTLLDWAILDTFDALGAKYDRPMSSSEVKLLVDCDENGVLDVFYGSNGIVVNVKKEAIIKAV